MTPSASLETPASAPPLWPGLAALVGGGLWILFYVTSVLVGRELDGAPPEGPGPALRDWGSAAFSGASVALGASLVGLSVRLRRRAPKLGGAGALLACLALGAGVLNGAAQLGLLGASRFLAAAAGLGVLAVCISAVLLGLAARRARALPAWAATLLLVTGVLTVVLILASGLRLGSVPGYLLDDLPFAIAGSLWLLLGKALLARGAA